MPGSSVIICGLYSHPISKMVMAPYCLLFGPDLGDLMVPGSSPNRRETAANGVAPHFRNKRIFFVGLSSLIFVFLGFKIGPF